MNDSSSADLTALVELARNRGAADRRQLLELVSEMFLSNGRRLSDQERALLNDILSKLVGDVEMAVRRKLAERLSALEAVPEALVERLANDEIEVARPLLLKSPVLREPELIRIVKWRGQEHQLAIARRDNLSEAVSEALIESGDEDVIGALIENRGSRLSQAAIAYLVEESRRFDHFREPLLLRPELPPRLAHRMFWWVSAALRQQIISQSGLSVDQLDEQIETATFQLLQEAEQQPTRSDAERLAAELASQRALNEPLLVKLLRQNRVPLFLACFARMTGIDMATARQLTFDGGGEGLAVACRAATFDRGTFATLFMLTRTPQHGAAGRAPLRTGRIEEILGFFDSLQVPHARRALRYWRQDSDYIAAIAALG